MTEHAWVVNRQAFMDEMMMDGETIRELYGYFVEELRQDAQALAGAHAERDVAAYARLVHKIKGTAATYHADPLHVLLVRTDALLKAGEADTALTHHPGIEAAVAEVLSEIGSWD